MAIFKNGSWQLFDWFSTMKKEYLLKSPHEKWFFIRNINSYMGRVIGCNFMDSNYKFSIRAFPIISLMAHYFSLLFYTLFYYRNNYLRALQSTPASGIYVPGLILVIMIIIPSTRRKLRYMYNFAGEYLFGKNESRDGVRDRMAIALLSGTARVLILISVSFSFLMISPIYENLFTNVERQMIIPVILPFVNSDTDNGFYINLVTQMICSAFGAIIVPASEIITCVLKNTISTMAAIIEDSLDNLSNEMEIDTTFTHQRAEKIKNIIKQILDFDKFVADLTDLFYWKFLIQPCILMYSVTMTIYLFLNGGWITGLGCTVCCYTQLLILCDVGKEVEDANTVIEDALNRIPFYLLPPRTQKMLGFVLGRVQNGAKIRIGPFAVLNYETATKLTKTIYTYLMFMLRI